MSLALGAVVWQEVGGLSRGLWRVGNGISGADRHCCDAALLFKGREGGCVRATVVVAHRGSLTRAAAEGASHLR